MNKDTTPMPQIALLPGTNPSMAAAGQDSLKATLSTFSTPDPGATAVLPGIGSDFHPPVPSANQPTALTEPAPAKRPAWRDPSTFMGELLVHLAAAAILTGITFVAAHVTVHWH